jgi:hypothetical protein
VRAIGALVFCLYIESGAGEVNINGVGSKIKQGDVVFFESGEKIFWNGNFTLPKSLRWNLNVLNTPSACCGVLYFSIHFWLPSLLSFIGTPRISAAV